MDQTIPKDNSAKVLEAIDLNERKVKIYSKKRRPAIPTIKGILHNILSLDFLGQGLVSNLFKALISSSVLVFVSSSINYFIDTRNFFYYLSYSLSEENAFVLLFGTLFFFHMKNYYAKWSYLASLFNRVIETESRNRNLLELGLIHDILIMGMHDHDSFKYVFNKFLIDNSLFEEIDSRFPKYTDKVCYELIVMKIYEKSFVEKGKDDDLISSNKKAI